MATLRNTEIVIGEGITEKYYFDSMRDVLKNKPKPISLKPYNLEELEKAIREFAEQGYTKIHCLIDMDNKIDNGTKQIKYRELKEKYHNKIISRPKKGVKCEVCFYESHPSTEVFFYYYFEYSTAEKTNEGLKNWLNNKCGYEVKERFMEKHSLHGIFKKNGGCLKRAIENSLLSVTSREKSNYNFIYTEIGKLITELGIKEEV